MGQMMELHLLSKDKHTIEFEVAGASETLLEPLKQKLLADKNVEAATYYIGHPMSDNPKLYVRVKEGSPQSALKKAAKALVGEFNECKLLIEKHRARKK